MDVTVQYFNPSSPFSLVVVLVLVIIRDLYSQYVFTLTNIYHFLWLIISSYNSSFFFWVQLVCSNPETYLFKENFLASVP